MFFGCFWASEERVSGNRLSKDGITGKKFLIPALSYYGLLVGGRNEGKCEIGQWQS
ncbi:MAG: hypothetical protein QOH50_5259 [Kribbellaceae bacterium]|nr:hypothetical protein [Kribbellaceae bacterium]